MQIREQKQFQETRRMPGLKTKISNSFENVQHAYGNYLCMNLATHLYMLNIIYMYLFIP